MIEILQVQISKSKSEVAKSKNVSRDKYVLRVRFDNWAPVIDQREKWVELLVQSALSQVCLVNFVCRFSRNYGKIWPNSGKSHYRPQKNIKFLTEKSPLQKTFSKNRELVKISNDQQIARWDPNPDFAHVSSSCNKLCRCGDTSSNVDSLMQQLMPSTWSTQTIWSMSTNIEIAIITAGMNGENHRWKTRSCM